jgi:putative transposase
VAKVGDIRIRWSRPLPSEPSRVTVIRGADGRCYASFVVEVAATPLPVTPADIGIDLGLSTLAATSAGELIANPRHLRARERHLAKAQRALCRKQSGPANRAKARVRDNQSVYVEDLAVSGLARTRLAKSVRDAGWAMLVRLLGEKADRYGRSVVKVDRWFPSSQICAACGHKDGPKPLGTREWACGNCGILHQRDINAARNVLIEGRKVAAGRADSPSRLWRDRKTGLRPGASR